MTKQLRPTLELVNDNEQDVTSSDSDEEVAAAPIQPLFSEALYSCITLAINLGKTSQVKRLDDLREVLSERGFTDDIISSALKVIAGAMSGESK